MLLADSPTITISLEAAGTLAVGIAGAIMGAAKLMVAYLDRKDKTLINEIKAGRDDRNRFADTVIHIHREAMQAVNGVTKALTIFNERFANETGEHVPLDPDQIVEHQQPVTLPKRPA